MTKIDKSRLNYKMGKRMKLVPKLEKAISNFADDQWQFTYEEKEEDHHWHPSTHPTMPVSHLYVAATIDPESVEWERPPNSLLKTYQVGHFWHQWLQYLAVRAELCDQDNIERKAIKGYGDGPYEAVAGSADICPILLRDEWEGGIDFKSMNAHSYNQPGLPHGFADKYECQMAMYMWLFDQPRWLIVAINKDNGEMKEFEFVRDDMLVDAILDKFEYVSESIREGHVITSLEDEKWPKLPLQGPVLS